MALTNSQQPGGNVQQATGNRQLATSWYGVTLALHHFDSNSDLDSQLGVSGFSCKSDCSCSSVRFGLLEFSFSSSSSSPASFLLASSMFHLHFYGKCLRRVQQSLANAIKSFACLLLFSPTVPTLLGLLYGTVGSLCRLCVLVSGIFVHF